MGEDRAVRCETRGDGNETIKINGDWEEVQLLNELSIYDTVGTTS